MTELLPENVRSQIEFHYQYIASHTEQIRKLIDDYAVTDVCQYEHNEYDRIPLQKLGYDGKMRTYEVCLGCGGTIEDE